MTLPQILESASDIKCLGTFISGKKAIPQILEKKPDVVFMNVKLHSMSGIQCVAAIKKLLPDMQIIMVTAYGESEQIFHALKAGADGCLVKSSPPEQPVHGIRDARTGGAPMPGHIARNVVQNFHFSETSVHELGNLSPRNREVLSLLASGFTYNEISSKLNITFETVRTHVKKICKKMRARNRVEAVAKYRPDLHDSGDLSHRKLGGERVVESQGNLS